MEKFIKLTAPAAALMIANIDTDMIIPKQYLKTIKRSGLGKWLFAEMRYDTQGKPVTDFVLNLKPQAKILMAGENFGCGSSREHAPWSLMDFGIRAVVAPSFADIFYNNSFKNGLLLVKLPQEKIDELVACGQDVTIDLEQQTVSGGSHIFAFEIEPNIKEVLLGGWDAIAAVLKHREDIENYEAAHFARQPWLKGEESHA